MKVLVIEDDPGIIEVVSLCFQLRWSGTTVISASTGNKGLELVETESPDVVILDIGLPDALTRPPQVAHRFVCFGGRMHLSSCRLAHMRPLIQIQIGEG